jgi:hypothetical protein
MRRDRLHQRQEGRIEAQVLVLGMVDDVRQLLGMQARIDRVQHRAGTGDRVIRFHVAVAVPGQRGHALAHRHAEPAERVGQPARSCVAVAVGIAVQVALDAARDDLAGAEMAVGVRDDAGDEQRLLHHLTRQGAGWHVRSLFFRHVLL